MIDREDILRQIRYNFGYTGRLLILLRWDIIGRKLRYSQRFPYKWWWKYRINIGEWRKYRWDNRRLRAWHEVKEIKNGKYIYKK